jgi:hypothetical protein
MGGDLAYTYEDGISTFALTLQAQVVAGDANHDLVGVLSA